MKKHALIIAAFTALLMAGCSSEPVAKAEQKPAAKVEPVQAKTQATAQQPVMAQSDYQQPPVMHQHTHNYQQETAQPPKQEPPKPVMQQVEKPVKKPYRQPQLIKITGIGYGAESTYEAYTPGQRRLMAIRASKLDAYRSLAEQLHGIKIDSNTSISTLTAKNDSFRARVNAIVRGARVVSVTPMADRNYETVLEVFVDRNFFNNAFVYTNCPQNNCEIEPIDPADLCNSGLNCQSVGSR